MGLGSGQSVCSGLGRPLHSSRPLCPSSAEGVHYISGATYDFD
jgi:hypothetical protein